MKKARAINTLVFLYQTLIIKGSKMNSMYLKAGMKPQSPPEKSKRKKKPKTHSFNLVLIYAFHLCPTCSGYSGASV